MSTTTKIRSTKAKAGRKKKAVAAVNPAIPQNDNERQLIAYARQLSDSQLLDALVMVCMLLIESGKGNELEEDKRWWLIGRLVEAGRDIPLALFPIPAMAGGAA